MASETDDQRFQRTVRKLLKTPPKPHKARDDERKQAPDMPSKRHKKAKPDQRQPGLKRPKSDA